MTNTRDITDFRYNENRNTDWTLLSSLVNNTSRLCNNRSSSELAIIHSLLKYDYVNNQEGVELWFYITREQTTTKDFIRNFDNKEFKNSIFWFMDERLKINTFKLKIDQSTKEPTIVCVQDEDMVLPFNGSTDKLTLRLPYHNCYDEFFLIELRKYWYKDWQDSAKEFDRILQDVKEENDNTYNMVEILLTKYPDITLQVVEKEYDNGGGKRIEEVVGVVKNDVGFKYLVTKRGERLDARNYVVYNYELISILLKGE